MTWAQRGIYEWLLDEQWEDGGLPGDATEIASMIGNNAAVDDVARVLELAFDQAPDGKWWNARAEEIRDQQDWKSEVGRMGGQASGEARRRVGQSGAGQSDTLEPTSNGPPTETKDADADLDAEPDSKGNSSLGDGSSDPPPPALASLGFTGPTADALEATGVWAAQWRIHVGKYRKRLAEAAVPRTFAALIRDFGDDFVADRVRSYDRWRNSKGAGRTKGRKRHDVAIKRWVEKDAEREGARAGARRPAPLSEGDRARLAGA